MEFKDYTLDYTLDVFLDIEGTFDSTFYPVTKATISSHNVPDSLIEWTQSMLAGRALTNHGNFTITGRSTRRSLRRRGTIALPLVCSH